MLKRISWAVVAIIVLWAACFWYVLELQRVFYTSTGPYFDSVSYYMQLAWSIEKVHSAGFWRALSGAFVGSNVAIVGVVGSLIGLLTDKPALWMGPAIQAPWILLFWLTLYGYFRRALDQTRLISLLASSLFIINAGMLYFDRGWSDFAMDLMGYVILGNALVFYFWSCHSDRRWPLVAAGLLFGFTTWWRVPDAVYIALILLPLEILRFWKAPSKWAWLKRLLWLAIPAALVAGVFLVPNRTFLHWYYVIMNVDVNAHQPLAQSLRHWEYLWHDRMGTLVVGVLLAWFMVRTLQVLASYRRDRVCTPLNWGFLWCGLVPVGYLIFSGSGPNAYVCFPSVFGLSLFLLFPWKHNGRLTAIAIAILALLTLGCWGQVLLDSYARHVAGQAELPRAAMEAALSYLTQDAQARHLSRATVAVGYVGFWNAYAWQHMLVYLHSAHIGADGAVCYQQTTFTPRVHYDWMDAIQSGSPAALDRSFGGLDYIYLLKPSVTGRFTRVRWGDTSTAFIDRFARAIHQRYTLIPVGAPVVLSDFEQFRLFRLMPR